VLHWLCVLIEKTNTMSNLTLALDDDLLRAARIKAVQQGTSVNEICRQAIARFAEPANEPADFLAELRAISARVQKSARSKAPTAPLWPGREAMYEEAMAERMPTLWASFDGHAAAALAAETPAVKKTQSRSKR
jgi:hypothetical protein